MKNIILLGLVFSAVTIFTGCQALGESITITENLSFDHVEEISIDVSSADVVIVKENRHDILVEFGTYKNGDKLKTSEGKKTTIETYNKNNLSLNMNTDYWLTIYVPEEFDQDFSFNLSSGSIELKDFDVHDIRCDFSSGDIDFSNLTANEIDLDLSSGHVNFNNVTAELLKTNLSSGDVTLKDFTGRIKGSSSSGKFNVAYKDTMNDLDFSASSGTIKVDYSKVDIDGSFDLSKSSGDIDINIGLDYSNDDDHVRGDIGSGKYNVDLDISSGDIIITK